MYISSDPEQQRLYEILTDESTHAWAFSEALDSLTDQELLRLFVYKRIEPYTPDLTVRIAMDKITDASILRRMRASRIDFIRMAAAYASPDRYRLRMALRDPSEKVRRYAVGQIYSDDTLLTLLRESRDPGIRDYAAEHLRSDEAIAQLAESDLPDEYRLIAVDHLTDQAVLKRIAAGSSATELRVAALRRIEDPDFLAEQSMASPSDEISFEAGRQIVSYRVIEHQMSVIYERASTFRHMMTRKSLESSARCELEERLMDLILAHAEDTGRKAVALALIDVFPCTLFLQQIFSRLYQDPVFNEALQARNTALNRGRGGRLSTPEEIAEYERAHPTKVTIIDEPDDPDRRRGPQPWMDEFEYIDSLFD